MLLAARWWWLLGLGGGTSCLTAATQQLDPTPVQQPTIGPTTQPTTEPLRLPFVVQTLADVLAAARAAEGTDAAVAAVHNRLESGASEALMQGGYGIFSRLTTAEGLQYTVVTGQGNYSRVFVVDGKQSWESLPGKVKEVPAAELDLALRRTALFPIRDIDRFFAKVELVGTETEDKKEAFVLRLTSKFDPDETETWFIDRESGLLIRRDYMTFGRFGRIPATTRLGDYRDVDGVKVPFLLITNTDGFLQQFKVAEVKQNTEVDASLFRKPEPQPGAGKRK